MTRRLTAVAGIAAVLLGLAACRSNPDVAAYVGDEQLTQAQVSEMYSELRAAQTPEFLETARQVMAQAGQPVPTRWPLIEKKEIVLNWVLGRTCELAKAEGGFESAQVTTADIEQRDGIPANTQYARLLVEARGCILGLPTQPVQPTEGVWREIFDNGVAQGFIPAEASFEEVLAEWSNNPQTTQIVAGSLAQREAIGQLVEDADISVNPEYRPLTHVVLLAEDADLLVVELDGSAGAVTDQ